MDQKPQSTSRYQLRSQQNLGLSTKSLRKSIEGMRLIDMEKLLQAWNAILREHWTAPGDCDVPTFQIAEEKKWGLAWEYAFKCENCSYVSDRYKLYKEVITKGRGRRATAVNSALQIGLQDTPLGNTRTRRLVAALDVSPPSRTAMQKTSNRVSHVVTELNTKDMAEKVEAVRRSKRLKGEDDKTIDISTDARYNSVTITSSRKPGQNASQAVALAVETSTQDQYIVSASVQNKLCWTGSWLRGRGFDVKCPGGYEDCTANINPHAPWSEQRMGREIGEDLARQGVLVQHVTTDGDARSAQGVEDGCRLVSPLWKVERLADPTHLGRSQFKRCIKALFSDTMFPGRTKADRRKAQRVFSQDVKARCSLVFRSLMTEYGRDNIDHIKQRLPFVLEATTLCYDGDCSDCPRHSVVCPGEETDSWWQKSFILHKNKLSVLNMNDNDRSLLREILKMKLSEEAVHTLRMDTSTQKCEALNLSISVSLPKNVNYSRNVHGRVASTIHRINHGQENSTSSKLAAVGANPPSPRAERTVYEFERERQYKKAYQTSSSAKGRQLRSAARRLDEHLAFQRAHPGEITDYKKSQLDDHCYALPCS